MKTSLFSIKGLSFFGLLAGGFATAGFVLHSNLPVPQNFPAGHVEANNPHGLTDAEVLEVTRVNTVGPDILVSD